VHILVVILNVGPVSCPGKREFLYSDMLLNRDLFFLPPVGSP